MTWSKDMDELHRIRVEIFEELEGLTPQERMNRLNRDAEEIIKRYKLNIKVKQLQNAN